MSPSPRKKIEPEVTSALGLSKQSASELTFSSADHQFLVRLLNQRDESIMDEFHTLMKNLMVELYEKDSERLCKSVAEIVIAQNKFLHDAIEDQTKEIKELAKAIEGNTVRLGIIEKQVFDVDEKRLVRLERYTSLSNTIIRYIGWGIVVAANTLWFAKIFHSQIVK